MKLNPIEWFRGKQMTTLERLMSELEEKKGECLGRFNRLAYGLADEEEGTESEGVDLGDVQKICTDAGKTLEELSEKFSRIKQRRRKSAELDAAAAASVEKTSIIERIEASAAKVVVAQRQHDSDCYPLRVRLGELDALIMRRHGIEQELRALFDDQDVLDREDWVMRRIKTVEREIDQQRDLVLRIRENLERLQANDHGKSESTETTTKRQRWENEKRKLDELATERDQLIEELNDIDRQKISG